MNVDELANSAYRSLQIGEHIAALSTCEQALSLAHDRPKLQARLHSWKAQALMAAHRYKEAQAAALRGLSIARRCGDGPGVAAVRDLHRQIVARMAALAPPPERPTQQQGLRCPDPAPAWAPRG